MSHIDVDEATRFLNDYSDVMMAALQSYSEQMKAAAAPSRISPAAKGDAPALRPQTLAVDALDGQADGVQKYAQTARTAEEAFGWLFEKYAPILAPPPPGVPS